MLLVIGHILIFSSPWTKHTQKNNQNIFWSLNCKHWFESLHWFVLVLVFVFLISVQSACWGMISYCLIFITIQSHSTCFHRTFEQYSKWTSSFHAAFFEVTLICNLIFIFIHRHDWFIWRTARAQKLLVVIILCKEYFGGYLPLKARPLF